MKVSSCVTFTVVSVLALLSTSTLSAHPVPAAPAPKLPSKPAPPASKKPLATLYAADNFKGKSFKVSKYGCLELASLGVVSSVRYRGGPKADLQFFSGKACKGKVAHHMDTSSFPSMGGPYKTLSVLVSKV